MTDTLILMLIFATLAQAWSWLGSYGAVVSLGHAVFFGIGAYAVAISNLRGGSPWYGALGGALFAVAVGAVCGGFLVRGRGLAFSALTLAAGVCAAPFVAAHAWVGPGNVFTFPHRPGFLNLQFEAAWPYLLLALAVFGVTQTLTVVLRSSRVGYYLRALRSNADAARSLGVAARPQHLIVLIGSAFVTSVAGSLFAEYRLGVSPPADFGLAVSLDIALAGIVAGPRWMWGAPVAGMLLALLQRFVPLHAPGPAGAAVLVVEGLAVVALAALRPDGIFAPPAIRPAALARTGA